MTFLYADDMRTIIAVKLRKKLGCRMCEKFQLTGMKGNVAFYCSIWMWPFRYYKHISAYSFNGIYWSELPLSMSFFGGVYVYVFPSLHISRTTVTIIIITLQCAVTTQQQENNLFKTENMTSSIYDPSEASIGWSVVMASIADQFFYFRLLSDKEGHKKWFGGWLKPNMWWQLKFDLMGFAGL